VAALRHVLFAMARLLMLVGFSLQQPDCILTILIFSCLSIRLTLQMPTSSVMVGRQLRRYIFNAHYVVKYVIFFSQILLIVLIKFLNFSITLHHFREPTTGFKPLHWLNSYLSDNLLHVINKTKRFDGKTN